MRRLPFLLKPRTWLITAAGVLAGVVLWFWASETDCSHARRHCTPASPETRELMQRPDRYGAVLILGAVVGLMTAYVSEAPVRRRPPPIDES